MPNMIYCIQKQARWHRWRQISNTSLGTVISYYAS